MTFRESSSQFLARLKDPYRWKSAIFDVLLWFMAGVVLTTIIARVTPGYPILVGTHSIATGLYWLDKTAFNFQRGDVVSYTFAPDKAWLRDRYGFGVTHTKTVGAVEGDEVIALEKGYIVCPKVGYSGVKLPCSALGAPLEKDSKGRLMTAWLRPGQKITLAPGEVWLYAPNPRSLDSRYVGPVRVTQLHGKAKILWQWQPAPEEPFKYPLSIG